jgi:hypothetical protein
MTSQESKNPILVIRQDDISRSVQFEYQMIRVLSFTKGDLDNPINPYLLNALKPFVSEMHSEFHTKSRWDIVLASHELSRMNSDTSLQE